MHLENFNVYLRVWLTVEPKDQATVTQKFFDCLQSATDLSLAYQTALSFIENVEFLRLQPHLLYNFDQSESYISSAL